ncbi:hypothetical protein GCM10009834_37150 [Streptomonospora arabica]
MRAGRRKTVRRPGPGTAGGTRRTAPVAAPRPCDAGPASNEHPECDRVDPSCPDSASCCAAPAQRPALHWEDSGPSPALGTGRDLRFRNTGQTSDFIRDARSKVIPGLPRKGVAKG